MSNYEAFETFVRNTKGRKVKTVIWPDCEDETGRHITATDEIDIVWYQEEWGESVIVAFKAGIEFARYNPRYVEAIIWL